MELWVLTFLFSFNYILFISHLFTYHQKQTKAFLKFFMLTELVVLIEGLELDLSFEFSETFLSLNHMSPPAPNPPITELDRLSTFSFFLLFSCQFLIGCFPFCQKQSACLFWLFSELFGFIN